MAELAAPLVAGNDLTTMSAATGTDLTKRAVIAVDQDPQGPAGTPRNEGWRALGAYQPPANGDRAVVLFNATDHEAAIATPRRVAIPPSYGLVH